MAIVFFCPECDRRYKVHDDKAGRSVRCKDCGGRIKIPHSGERTPGGQPVYRHAERQSEFQLAVGDGENIDLISDHIESHIGPVKNVYHELLSDLVHLDVHIVEPSRKKPCFTLITTGMSDLPMTVPDGLEDFAHAELLICLPPDWKLDQKALQDPNYNWPIVLLKTLARMPHEYSTWLGFGHTIPNGDPAKPYANNTQLTGAILIPPIFAGEEFCQLELSDKTINFYSIVPLYPQEMDLKLKTNADTIFEKLDRKFSGIPFLTEPDRPNVAKSRFGFF